MMEGSEAGSVLVTNGSGCGSGRHKNIRIRIWIRIRIPNTGWIQFKISRIKDLLPSLIISYLLCADGRRYVTRPERRRWWYGNGRRWRRWRSGAGGGEEAHHQKQVLTLLIAHHTYLRVFIHSTSPSLPPPPPPQVVVIVTCSVAVPDPVFFVDSDPNLRFWWPKIGKNLQLQLKFIFFDNKNCNLLICRPP